MVVAKMAYNGLQLTEGRDFNHKTTMEARNFNTPQNFLRSSKPLWLGVVSGSVFLKTIFKLKIQ
jgi:hypothetical protein